MKKKKTLKILKKIQKDINFIKHDIKEIKSVKKSKYTLAELLSQCDLDAPIPKALKDWESFFSSEKISNDFLSERNQFLEKVDRDLRETIDQLHSVILSNPLDDSVPAIKIECLITNTKIPLTISESVSNKLKLTEVDTRDLIISKKVTTSVKYVGPIQVRYLDKVAFTGAIMVGDVVVMSSSLIKSME